MFLQPDPEITNERFEKFISVMEVCFLAQWYLPDQFLFLTPIYEFNEFIYFS